MSQLQRLINTDRKLLVLDCELKYFSSGKLYSKKRVIFVSL